MAAAHLSEARVLALAASTLTLCGYKVTKDSLGGTQTQKAAMDIMETELALAEGELQTDHEPFLRVFDSNYSCPGPLDAAVAAQAVRALAIAHG